MPLFLTRQTSSPETASLAQQAVPYPLQMSRVARTRNRQRAPQNIVSLTAVWA